MTSTAAVDLLVVGGGIVGLAHALHAVDRGLTVHVVDRDQHAVGASVQNFGHVGTTVQAGRVLAYAEIARRTWLRLGAEAGVDVQEAGTLVAARSEAELAVLEDLADRRGAADVRLLTTDAVQALAPLADDVVGGALLPRDLRVDQRTAAARLAAHLEARGVRFSWGTAVTGVEPGLVRTTRGDLRAAAVAVCVGSDVDRLDPDVADRHGVARCVLHMLRVRDPHGRTIGPAVLTGSSTLRYGAFADAPALAAVRAEIAAASPAMIAADVNLMLTQRPDGSIVLGDTHRTARTPDPFDDEAGYELLLEEGARLLGVDSLRVLERWRGVYATAPEPFLVETPAEGVRIVSVTSGVGMTTALGLAADVLDGLLEPAVPQPA